MGCCPFLLRPLPRAMRVFHSLGQMDIHWVHYSGCHRPSELSQRAHWIPRHFLFCTTLCGVNRGLSHLHNSHVQRKLQENPSEPPVASFASRGPQAPVSLLVVFMRRPLSVPPPPPSLGWSLWPAPWCPAWPLPSSQGVLNAFLFLSREIPLFNLNHMKLHYIKQEIGY